MVALTAVLGATGCQDSAPELPDKPGPAVAVTLTVRHEATPTALTWRYTVRNDEPADIAVFNGSSGEVSGGKAPYEGVWVTPRSDGTVEVAQRLLAPPPGGVAREYTQYGLVLPAGAQLSGTATVRLPLKASHPYGSFFDPPLRLSEDPGTVVFCIGIARAADFAPIPLTDAPGSTATPADTSASPGPLYASADAPVPPGTRKALYAHGRGGQHLACAPPERLG